MQSGIPSPGRSRPSPLHNFPWALSSQTALCPLHWRLPAPGGTMLDSPFAAKRRHSSDRNSCVSDRIRFADTSPEADAKWPAPAHPLPARSNGNPGCAYGPRSTGDPEFHSEPSSRVHWPCNYRTGTWSRNCISSLEEMPPAPYVIVIGEILSGLYALPKLPGVASAAPAWNFTSRSLLD